MSLGKLSKTMVGLRPLIDSMPLIYCKSCYHLFDSRIKERCHPCLFCPDCLSSMTAPISTSSDGKPISVDVSDEDEVKRLVRSFENRVTATRCGFCATNAKRCRLVKFCYHCKKCLCSKCSDLHDNSSHYKHHASTSLQDKRGLVM